MGWKTADILILLLLIAMPLVTPLATVYALPEEEYTYSTITFAAGDIYSTIKLQVPKYITIDRDVKVYAYFDRTGCNYLWDVHFTIGVRINTTSGSMEYELATSSFSLSCGAPNHQTNELELTIPRAVYDSSVDKMVSIYVKSVVITNMLGSPTVVTNVPAQSYLVQGVPQPMVVVEDVDLGYLNLTMGEARDVTIMLTSMYAPIVVEGVNATLPGFISLYVNTPLPLNIGTNQTKPIVVRFRGEEPGVGVASIVIYYYTGSETKWISVYIPVLCEENRIQDLLNQYSQELNRLRQEALDLESQLGIRVDTMGNLTQQLSTIITALSNLIPQYALTLQRVSDLESKTASISNALTNMSSELRYVENSVSDLNSSLNNRIQNLENQVASTSGSLQALASTVSELSSNLNATMGEVVALKSEVSELKKTNTILAASAMVSLVIIITLLAILVRKRF